MSDKLWLFEAMDTLFFRDGSPFNAGESDSRGIKSSFPPAMATVQGAIRTALAVSLGWTRGSRWPEEVLGSNDNIGPLKLIGPYLALAAGRDIEFLYPFPATVVKHKEGFAFMAPNEASVVTDLMTETQLTSGLHVEEVENTGGLWLTTTGLEKILSGGQPAGNDWHYSGSLWHDESRIGIRLDRSTGTVVQEGGLYALTHIRPTRGLRIAVSVSGIEEKLYQSVPQTIPLGGESRMAKISILDAISFLPGVPVLTTEHGKVNFTVTLITPGMFAHLEADGGKGFESSREEVVKVIREGPLEGFGSCISACIPKLSQVGGWDIANRRPRPLRPVIIPGATWFYRVAANRVDEIASLHGSQVGLDTDYGYGQIVIGRWVS